MLEKPEFEKNDFMYRFAAGITVASGIFSLIVFTLLVVNYIQIRQADPVNHELMTQMRLEYADKPEQDELLAERVQTLDLLTRKAFFTSQNHLRIGGILLLVGIVTFLVAFKNMARWRPEAPALAEQPTAEVEFLAYAESRNLITWAGVGMLALGLFSSLMSERVLVGGVRAVDASAQDAAAAPGEAAEEEADVVAFDAPSAEAILANWPAFRGPGGLALAQYDNAPTEWDGESGTAIKWSTEVALGGTNSPVIWGNKLFLSGADETTREIYCFDTETGERLWMQRLEPFDGTPPTAPGVNEETGYAASTLVAHGDRLVAIFSNGDVVSYDFDGNFVWGKNLGVPDNHYGYSSSLIAHGRLVFLQLDHMSEGRLLALDIMTGEVTWKKDREFISWASPIIAETPAGPQLVLADQENLDAYNPETGELLWSQTCLGGEVAPSAAYSNGIFFAANEYAQGAAVRVSDGGEPEVLWEWDELLPEVSSPVGDGERFYIATSMGDLVSLDAETGEALWTEEVSYGFYASPVLVGDKIYIMDMEGTMYIVRAGSEYELIGTSKIAGTTLTTPAFMDGRIYLRTDTHIMCIE